MLSLQSIAGAMRWLPARRFTTTATQATAFLKKKSMLALAPSQEDIQATASSWARSSRSFAGAAAGAARSFGTATGEEVFSFGKLKGMTYEQAAKQEHSYCKWALQELNKGEVGAVAAFAQYLQTVNWQPPAKAERSWPNQSWQDRKPQADAPREVRSRPPPRSTAEPASSSSFEKRSRESPGAKEELPPSAWLVGVGKHKDKTIGEVFEQDEKYCQWAAKESLKAAPQPSSKNLMPLVVYAQAKWLERKPVQVPTGRAAPAAKQQAMAEPSKAPATPAPSRDDLATEASGPLEEGAWKVVAGKHKGMTFAEVFEKAPDYMKWATEECRKREQSFNSSLGSLAVYAQYRWLNNGTAGVNKLLEESRPNLLLGQSFVVTGEPESLSRKALEALIQLLGGKVTTKLTRSTTGLLLAGSYGLNGKPSEANPKYLEAKAASIPVIRLENLLQHAASRKASESAGGS